MGRSDVQFENPAMAVDAWSDPDPSCGNRAFKLSGVCRDTGRADESRRSGGHALRIDRAIEPVPHAPATRRLPSAVEVHRISPRSLRHTGGRVPGHGEPAVRIDPVEVRSLPQLAPLGEVPAPVKPRKFHGRLRNFSLGLLVLIALGYPLCFHIRHRDEAGARSPYHSKHRVDDGDGAPLHFFESHPDWVNPRVIRTWDLFTKAGTWDDIRPLIRSSQRDDLSLRRAWRPWKGKPVGETRVEMHSENDPPFVVLSGRCDDFTGYDAYFVREGDAMKLDWCATFQHGSVPFAKLSEAAEVRLASVRGWISHATFYNRAFPEDRYEAYQLSAGPDREYVWAYTPKSGSIANHFRQLLPGDPILLDKARSAKIMLRLGRGPVDADANQFLITDILHDEWVSP